MNLKALITTAMLVVGTSSAAFAAPRVEVVHDRAPVAVRVEDRRIVRPIAEHPIVVNRPVTRPIVERPIGRPLGHGPVVIGRSGFGRPVVIHPVWHPIIRPIVRPVIVGSYVARRVVMASRRSARSTSRSTARRASTSAPAA